MSLIDYDTEKFELNGSTYYLVNPQCADDFVDAAYIEFVLENAIKNFKLGEDPTDLCNLLEKQKAYIVGYSDSLGEFDNHVLIQNINYLTKNSALQIGTLENLLGISKGYISRTAKENSGKKMSIDVVWKIARFFGTDIRTLTEDEMWMCRENVELIENFLDKLYSDTQDGFVVWNNDGGSNGFPFIGRYNPLGFVVGDVDVSEVYEYHPRHLNSDKKWIISAEIFSVNGFTDKIKDLVIIPYELEDNNSIKGYDCYLVWEDKGGWNWEKVFFTSDSHYRLFDKVKKLYQLIFSYQNDIEIKPEIKTILADYISSRRAEQND